MNKTNKLMRLMFVSVLMVSASQSVEISKQIDDLTINGIKQFVLSNVDNKTEDSARINNLSSKEEKKQYNEKQAIRLMEQWVDDYLLKNNNAQLFVAKNKQQLDKYEAELKKPHDYNMVVLDRMLINNVLRDISKNTPEYQQILSSNLNYNIILSLFALNANNNKRIFNDIAKELDKHGFNLQNWNKILDIYNKADLKISEKLKQENTNKKLEISTPNSFSIIGNKSKTEQKTNSWDNLKIDKPLLREKIDSLNNNDKKNLLEDFSDQLKNNEIDLPDDFKVKNKSITQYLKSKHMSVEQQLIDIIGALMQYNILSQMMSLLNPFSPSISLMSTMFNTPKTIVMKKETPTEKQTIIVSKQFTPIISGFGFTNNKLSSMFDLDFGFTYSIFNNFMGRTNLLLNLL
ncbi:MAG: hypothetical protein IJ848_02120 [Alphaproteobacteria bacterium]|nr:hypothetical protein [Alphaproteobacteria bacterium]